MEALDATVQFLVLGRMGMLGNGPRAPVIAHITSFVKGVSKYKFYCCSKFDILILELFQDAARFGKFSVRHRWRQHYFQILLVILLFLCILLCIYRALQELSVVILFSFHHRPLKRLLMFQCVFLSGK